MTGTLEDGVCPPLRRLCNQAFFTHLYIDDEGTHGAYAEPFAVHRGAAGGRFR